MRYFSVCDGIGAVHVWHDQLGWVCAGTSEIEPFPAAVVEQRYGFENYGDFTRINRDGGPECGPVDLLVGGTPCQSFSIAGLRKGLDDPRGNLALEYLALADRLRCQWLVWENVPGVLSVDKGRAFGSFLGVLAKLGYGWAYRIIDAQYCGVPQRRRRVFVIAYHGDCRRAAAVLFERHSLQGHPAPRRKAGQVVANALRDRADRGGTNSEGQRLIANPLAGHHSRNDNDNELKGEGHDASEDGTGRGVPLTIHGTDKTVRVVSETDVAGSLRTKPPGYSSTTAIAHRSGVRRLMPIECERLQGFPDNYTLINYRGKPAKDGPRYRAIGNSMARPVMLWIGQRIDQVNAL